MMNRILVIDDDEAVRQLVYELLNMSGYEVITAADGCTGLSLARKEHPQLILCDIEMPMGDGYKVLEGLLDDDSSSMIPFIFLTARASPDELRKGMKLGADDYLTKPFTASELLYAVEARLKKKQLIEEHTQAVKERSDPAGHANKEFADNIAPLLNEGKRVLFRAGEMILMEGVASRHLVFIVKGRVKVSRTNEFGKVMLTGIYGPGEIVGDITMKGTPVIASSASALEDTEAVLVHRSEFQALLAGNSHAALGYMRMLASAVVTRERQMISIAYHGVRKRIAEALLALHRIYSPHNARYARGIPLHIEDLAYITGMTTESSYRVISMFEKESLLIRSSEGQIIIQDVNSLENIRDANSGALVSKENVLKREPVPMAERK